MKEEVKERGTIAWLIYFASSHKKYYVWSIILAVIGVTCSVLPYAIVAQMIGKLLNGEKNFEVYGKLGCWMLGFWLLRVLFHSISTSMSHKATFTVLGNIRKQLIQKLAVIPLGEAMSIPSGELKSIIVEKVDSIETTLAHMVPEVTANFFVPIGIIIYLFTQDWRMALVALITLPLGLIAYMGMMIDHEEKYGNYVHKNAVLNSTTVEYINGIKVIKAFNQSAKSYDKFTIAAKEAAASAIDWMRGCNIYFSIAMTIFPAVLIGVLPIGSYFYMQHSLTLSTFILTIILSLGIMQPLISTMSYGDDVATVQTIIGEITKILEKKELTRPAVLTTAIIGSDVELKHVNFAYENALVLNNVNILFKSGQVHALVGPSGSGKSTIAKLIASLWDVNSGNITIGKANIRDIPLKELNQLVAYVSQDNYLFDDTILNNIRMGDLNASDEKVIEVAQKSGCHEFILSLEDGYQTIVGSNGSHLSGGEQQRISIARAMMKDAPIVILDEASAYIDPENEAIIQKAVSELVIDKTLIVIAHRLSTIVNSDQIILINNGTVEASGVHEELLAKSQLYQNMWDAHISVKDSDVKEGDKHA